MSRLTIEISSEEHQKIKALAALQGKSIKDYVMQKLFASQSSEDVAFQQLKSLLISRIEEAENGGNLRKTITDIAEEELKAFRK
jgi:uncharacterized protein (DUF1778 family)